MDQEKAKREVEAQRYRLQVRLGLIAKEAQRSGNKPDLAAAVALREALDAVKISSTEWVDGDASKAISALKPRIIALQSRMGMTDYGAPMLPKWVRFLVYTAPAVLGLMIVAFIIARRQRKQVIAKSSIEALDE